MCSASRSVQARSHTQVNRRQVISIFCIRSLHIFTCSCYSYFCIFCVYFKAIVPETCLMAIFRFLASRSFGQMLTWYTFLLVLQFYHFLHIFAFFLFKRVYFENNYTGNIFNGHFRTPLVKIYRLRGNKVYLIFHLNFLQFLRYRLLYMWINRT